MPLAHPDSSRGGVDRGVLQPQQHRLRQGAEGSVALSPPVPAGPAAELTTSAGHPRKPVGSLTEPPDGSTIRRFEASHSGTSRTERLMRRNRTLATAAVVALTATLLVAGGPAASPASAKRPQAPTRVLIVLFDQMVPAYADQFDMPNFRSLRGRGQNFKKAYLGYMASETVIAHNVITSGRTPNTWAGRTRPTVTTPTSSARASTRCTSPATSAWRTSPPSRSTPDGLPQAGRLPARGLPRYVVHHRRREVLRRGVRDRGQRRHRRAPVQSPLRRDERLPDGLPQPVHPRNTRQRELALARGQERSVLPHAA